MFFTVPDLTWIMPDLRRIMPDLRKIMSDLTRIMPDLTWIEPDLAWVVKKPKTDMHSHPADHPDSPASVLTFTPCIHLVRMNLDILTALDRGYIKSHSASLDDPFNPSQFQKCLGFRATLAEKSRGSGGRETLLAEEKPSLRTVKADPYQKSLHLSFSFIFPIKCFRMFGLLKKSKPQQDIYFPFKTKQRNQRKRQNMFDDDEKRVRSGDRPFTKAKRSNRDVPDQNELQTYASLEKMLHKAIHVVRQLKKKGNNNTSSAPKQQNLTWIMPDLRRIMPDLRRIMPDLRKIMPDLTRIIPDLTWIEPDLDRARLSLGGEETKDGHAFSSGGPSGQSHKRPYLYPVHPSGSDESGHLDWSSPFSPTHSFFLWWLALDRGYIKSYSAFLDDLFNPSQFQKCRLSSWIIFNTQLK
ncbi:hypothetical protein IGI04_002185 [Brassica rapa subsp. trilocularis]|uniref:Uncharacterized protein n=1 Tax=Brassica rapa subsp. trilocularis TaxID=1813537 RepID=A0ABQ7NUU9_BRACM|nr:hypothetical protein IGI04_002185 [Brassica rapa subsp. trilocularis]